MTQYKTFADIEKIDPELARCFKQQGDAVRWCMAIEGPIANWVKSQKRGDGGKSIWEAVWFVSERKGIVNPKIARKTRAELLIKFCPDAFRDPENAMSFNPENEAKNLDTSMGHYKYIDDLKINDTNGGPKDLTEIINKIETLLDGQELPQPPSQPTLEECVESYLRNTIVDQPNIFPCKRIYIRRDYGDNIVPGISIAEYLSQKFLEEEKPSRILAYEFADYNLTANDIYAYSGKYSQKREIKLYLVSTHSFSRDIMTLAENKYIGLVLVNLNEGMSPESYSVQRSIEDRIQRERNIKMLIGESKMNTSLLIYDGERRMITTSLVESLISEHIPVKEQFIIRAPYLTNDYIEKIADELTRLQVEENIRRLNLLNSYILNYPYLNLLEINPFVIAEELSIPYQYEKLSFDEQLGFLDVNNGTIYLNLCNNNYPRDRFTFAHEIGHYQFHLSCFRKNYCISVGETMSTIGEKATIVSGELKWFEHHANHFAACLLMPKELVVELYSFLHYEYVQKIYGDPPGPLYYSVTQPETFDSYRNVVCTMARILNVSKQAMHLRLIKLGFLITPPKESSFNLSFNFIG